MFKKIDKNETELIRRAVKEVFNLLVPYNSTVTDLNEIVNVEQETIYIKQILQKFPDSYITTLGYYPIFHIVKD